MKVTEITNFLGLTNDNAKSGVDVPKVLQEPKPETKTLYTWTALSRPHNKNLDQKKIRTLIIIGIVISILLVAMQEFFMIIAVLSLVFVGYMLNQVPPEEVKYTITNLGVKYGELVYNWEEMKYYYFLEGHDMDVIAIDLVNILPGRLHITVQKSDKEKVSQLLSEYVTFLEKEPKTMIEHAYDSVADKIDLRA